MFDVITMGSSTVDAFANTDSELIEIKGRGHTEELIAYPLGAKILIDEMRYNVGGNGINVGVALSRMGFKTAYLGKIGDDVNGQFIMERLKAENLEFIGARGHQSGFSVILNSELGHDRTILTYKGCNNELKFEEIDPNVETKWIYLSSMFGDSFNTMERLAEIMHERGVKIAFNPSSTLAKKGIGFIKSIVEKTDLLVLNEEEAEYLVGKGTALENIDKLYALGPRTVVITMAGKGLLARQNDDVYSAKPTPGRVVKETTGAGDACTAGILAGIIHGKSMEDCIRIGMLNAESVLTHYGAHNKLLTKNEMEEKIMTDGREIEKL